MGATPQATIRLAEVVKTFRFEASHCLPNHDGKCARPHGHGYRVDVSVRGAIRPADGSPTEGMVCDFSDLSAAWRSLESRLDHRDLNDSIGAECGPTTAENIAAWIAGEFAKRLATWDISVTVWETATCRATVSL